jgi:hypothetical protein
MVANNLIKSFRVIFKRASKPLFQDFFFFFFNEKYIGAIFKKFLIKKLKIKKLVGPQPPQATTWLRHCLSSNIQHSITEHSPKTLAPNTQHINFERLDYEK